MFLPCFLKILLNLLRWHCLIKLYRFWAYKSAIRHLYIVLCFQPNLSLLLPSPFIPLLPTLPCPHLPFPLVITILLSVSMSFCFGFFLLFWFFFWFFLLFLVKPSCTVGLISSPYHPIPLTSDRSQSDLCIYQSVLFCLFILSIRFHI